MVSGYSGGSRWLRQLEFSRVKWFDCTVRAERKISQHIKCTCVYREITCLFYFKMIKAIKKHTHQAFLGGTGWHLAADEEGCLRSV
jgi:hypothetical protein